MNADCDIRDSYECYWDIASKFGLKRFTQIPENVTYYLTDFCPPAGYFSQENICERHYSGCNQEEKSQFQTMEKGYASLQNLTSNQSRCKSVGAIRECVDFDVMRNCSDEEKELPNENLEELKSRKKWSAVQLWLCVDHGLSRCNMLYHAGRALYIYRIAKAVIDLNTPYASEIPRAVNTMTPGKTTVHLVGAKTPGKTTAPLGDIGSIYGGRYPLYASWVTYGSVVIYGR